MTDQPTDHCDTCGEPVQVVKLFTGTSTSHLAWLHIGSRAGKGYHAVQVNGAFDPPQEDQP